MTSPTTGQQSTSPLAHLLVGLVRVYQRLSLLWGPRCRFHPTCSQYAIDSLRTHGLVRGLLLAARRLLRCHPWNPGGPDPVPPSTRISPVSPVTSSRGTRT